MSVNIPASVPNFMPGETTVDGRTIRYVAAGDGPVVVWLHGARGLRISETHIRLADTHRVVALEMPGFGGTAPPDTRVMSEYAAIVHSAVVAVAGGPCALVGMSFGSRVAAHIAIEYPEDVETLTLVAPGLVVPEGFEWPDPQSPPPQAALKAILYAHPDDHDLPELPDEIYRAQTALVRTLLRDDSEPLLASFVGSEVPIMLLFGTEDRIVPATMAAQYSAALPSVFAVFIYDAGHMIDEERPEAVAATISNFAVHKREHVLERGSSLIYA